LEFRILGPLEVLSGEQVLALPRAKQRVLVLALLLQPNEAISTDRLIEALWGERPPATATTALQGHVSQLRKLFPPDTLRTRAPGYELRVEPGELDLDRFQSFRAQAQAALVAGEPEQAAAALDQALALWRGAPLAELTYDAFAQRQIGMLEELRAETLEERVQVELELGRHGEAVAELEALVQAEPFRERRRAQLMLALYRAGRQAEALEVFQEGRRRLVDELGIEPGPALQDLQQQILAQDPALRPPPRRVAERPQAREARRAVTVIACGLDLDTSDPEALRGASERALAAVRVIVDRHGGVVERELPDLALATFGAAAVHEDGPLRAVRAADELRAELPVRVGVASGEVVIGSGGVIGEPVAHAQRLQLRAADRELLIDRATWQLVRGATELEPVGEAFRVFTVDAEAAGVPRRLDSPLVGRANELRLIESAFDRALVERTPQLVAVVGQAGVGKSRLVGELLARVGGRATVLYGRCLSYGEGITFWPVRELVREAVGAAEKDSAESVAAALRELLGDGDDLAQLVGLFGLGDPAASGTELFLAVRTLLERLAREQPVVVVFDDLEHAEQALLDLVDFLVDWSRDVPLTVVCIGRPELLERRTAWAGGRSSTISVSLDALSETDCAVLLENLLGGASLEPGTFERFTAAAEGNPLFLEQLVSMLIDDGLLQQEGGRWVATGDLAAVSVPPSIQLLLAARLDRLSQDELTVLECAAVEGAVFHREAVGAVVAVRAQTLDVDAAVRALVTKGLVRPTTSTYRGVEAYRFRHLLIRDAAYAGMPKEARGRLHERFAHWIESTAGDRVLELEEVLGHHLEQAYWLLEAVGKADVELAQAAAERLDRAGRRSESRGDFRSASSLFGRADDLYSAAGARHLELLPMRIAALRLAGNLRDARAAVDEARAAVQGGDRGLEAHVLVEDCAVRLMADPSVSLADVASVAERARRVFDELGDERGTARADALLGDVFLFRCQFGEAEEAFERVLVHARRAGDDQACSRAHGRLAQSAFLGPRPVVSAIARCEQILGESDADPSAKVFALAALGVLEAMRGRFDDARVRIAEARALGDEFGLDRSLALVPGFSGSVELLADDAVSAEAELRVGYTALRGLGELAVLATTAALLVQALERQGRLDEATELMAESEGAVGGADLVSQIYWAQARARVRARLGEPAVAERHAREAVAFAADTDMLAVRGAALLDLAAVLEPASKERVHALELALELFTAKGDEVQAEQARNALA
jgi:DNA-binding SARP family transcriptional activator